MCWQDKAIDFTRTSVFEQKDQTSAFVSKIDMESGQYLCTKLNICGPNVVFFFGWD